MSRRCWFRVPCCSCWNRRIRTDPKAADTHTDTHLVAIQFESCIMQHSDCVHNLSLAPHPSRAATALISLSFPGSKLPQGGRLSNCRSVAALCMRRQIPIQGSNDTRAFYLQGHRCPSLRHGLLPLSLEIYTNFALNRFTGTICSFFGFIHSSRSTWHVKGYVLPEECGIAPAVDYTGARARAA